MKQPLVPDDYAPVGSYRRNFELPTGWRGENVFLRFNGVGSAIYVWVNGCEKVRSQALNLLIRQSVQVAHSWSSRGP